jgi:heme exporter protein CcmD
MSGPHSTYILAAYGVTALVIVAMVLRAVIGYRSRQRQIDALEAAGARRRGWRER